MINPDNIKRGDVIVALGIDGEPQFTAIVHSIVGKPWNGGVTIKSKSIHWLHPPYSPGDTVAISLDRDIHYRNGKIQNA